MPEEKKPYVFTFEQHHEGGKKYSADVTVHVPLTAEVQFGNDVTLTPHGVYNTLKDRIAFDLTILQERVESMYGTPDGAPLKATPCGGCGATQSDQRCIGCLHDFGTPESAWVHNPHEAASIPPLGVYYSTEHNNFYAMDDGSGMGVQFYQRWKDQWRSFPTSPPPLLKVPQSVEGVEGDCLFLYFKDTGKWKYEGRGIFPPNPDGGYIQIDRAAIREANGGEMPGVSGDASDLRVVVIPDEACKEAHAYPRMLAPEDA